MTRLEREATEGIEDMPNGRQKAIAIANNLFFSAREDIKSVKNHLKFDDMLVDKLYRLTENPSFRWLTGYSKELGL